MRAGSIFDNVKVEELKVSVDEYANLSLSGKTDYVAAIIQSFRQNLVQRVRSRRNPASQFLPSMSG